MAAPALELLRFGAALSVLLLPGVLGVSVLFPERPAHERWILGSVAGLAAAVYVGFGLSYFRLTLFYAAWPVLAVAALLAWWIRKPRAPLAGRPEEAVGLLAIVLLAAAVPRFAIALSHEIPPGWDPSFHLLLAKKLALTDRMVFDWEPFENISLNYPVGSHVLIAIVSALAGIPLYAAFRLLIPALGVLSTALVYLYARHLTGRQEVGVFSALAYGLWAVYGSIDYYRWGGLPNLLAMAFLIAGLAVLQHGQAGVARVGLLALLLAAMVLSHHHVTLVAGLVLLGLLAHAWATRARRSETAARAPVDPGELFGGFVAAGVLTSFFLIPFALKAVTIGRTHAMLYKEPLFTPGVVAISLGPVLLAASALGVFVSRRLRDVSLGPLHTIAGSLLVVFLLAEYVAFYLTRWLLGTAYKGFTPSRFLTDLAYFLAVYAGIAVVDLKERLGLRTGSTLLACLALAVTNIQAWRSQATVEFPLRWLEAYRWIESSTPPDTLVMTDDPWAPYATWRRCAETPIPSSEPTREGTATLRLFDSLRAGRVPEGAEHLLIVQVRDAGAPPSLKPVLWKGASGVAVVELWPGRPRGPGPTPPG